jgi:hypothetical protein
MGTENGLRARLHSRGGRLAEAKMAEVEAGVIPVASGGQDGQFDEDDAAWSWSVQAAPAGPPNLYTVTVTVSHAARGQPFDLTLTQVLLDPAYTGSAAQAERPATTTDDTTGTTTGGTMP